MLDSQEVAQGMPTEEEKDDTDSDGGGFCAWLRQYAAKVSGGPVPKSEPFNQWDAFVVWGGVFGSLAFLELALTLLNGAHYRDEVCCLPTCVCVLSLRLKNKSFLPNFFGGGGGGSSANRWSFTSC